MIKIGLMGFGRIGRDIYRLAVDSQNIEVSAVSDVASPDILHYLLSSESGRDDKFNLEENYIVNDQFTTTFVRGVEPGEVPWEMYKVDIVVDATHKYRTAEELQKHLDVGAKRVIFTSLPEERVDNLIIYGINENSVKPSDKIISAGSSTTNALALALHTMDEALEVECANMTSIHAYTSDQPLQDVAGKSFRWSRSAAENIIPNENDSVEWLETILPQLKDKTSASSLNVPVQKGSLMDLSLMIKENNITSKQVNAIFIEAANKQPDLIEVINDPIVSSDVIGNPHTLVLDSQATMIVGENMVKILGWYDNGFSQAARILDVVNLYGNFHSSEEEN